MPFSTGRRKDEVSRDRAISCEISPMRAEGANALTIDNSNPLQMPTSVTMIHPHEKSAAESIFALPGKGVRELQTQGRSSTRRGRRSAGRRPHLSRCGSRIASNFEKGRAFPR
jgi:hypothetical protein